jgi:hypothetical protein
VQYFLMLSAVPDWKLVQFFSSSFTTITAALISWQGGYSFKGP